MCQLLEALLLLLQIVLKVGDLQLNLGTHRYLQGKMHSPVQTA